MGWPYFHENVSQLDH